MIDLSAVAVVNLAYACLVEHADVETRRKVDAMLEGRMDPDGTVRTDPNDESLPPGLRGVKAPAWWTGQQGVVATTTLNLPGSGFVGPSTSGGVTVMPGRGR